MDSGDIVRCELQKKYELQEKFIHDGKNVLPITYYADFVVTFKDGHTTVFDVKGMPDSVALLKRKLFWHRYPNIDYQWISYSIIDGSEDNYWVSYETIKEGRKERKKKKLEEKSSGK